MTRRLADYALGLIAFAVSLVVETWQWIRTPRECRHQGVARMTDGAACALCGHFMPWWHGDN